MREEAKDAEKSLYEDITEFREHCCSCYSPLLNAENLIIKYGMTQDKTEILIRKLLHDFTHGNGNELYRQLTLRWNEIRKEGLK